MNNIKVALCLSVLLTAFCIYNALFYHSPGPQETKMGEKAVRGQHLWRQYNCNSCHQLYGLGGYLGPDLTNETARRGPDFIKAMFNAGSGSMPSFNFSAQEQDELLEFLRAVDATGNFPDHHAKTGLDGWVTISKK